MAQLGLKEGTCSQDLDFSKECFFHGTHGSGYMAKGNYLAASGLLGQCHHIS